MMKSGVTIPAVLLLGLCAMGAAAAAQQNQDPAPGPANAGDARAQKNYQAICQPCHGPKGDSPMPTMSLVDGEWTHGSSTKEIAKVITDGVPGTAMLPNKGKLSDEEILELAKLVRSFDPKLKPEKASSK